LRSERFCSRETYASHARRAGNDRGFARQKHIPSEKFSFDWTEYG
jgi:hypothetical protein